MKVTVAICTWNRANLLDQTLAQMHNLRIPEGVEWELLVVNNNCTDDTDAVIARHRDALPLRRLHEPKQGHSHSRNCAIAVAQGELLLWTDDDVLVDVNWLAEHVRAANEWPEASFFGGTIDPWFSVTPPRWIKRDLPRFTSAYAIRQLGSEVRPFAPGELPFGANVAFRTGVLKAFPFNPSLGRVGATLISGDETDVLFRMRQAGHSGIWVGTAQVRHYIPPERLTAKYLWKFHCGISQTRCRMEALPEGKRLFGAPQWAWRGYLENLVLCTFLAPWRNRMWLDAFLRAAFHRGILSAACDQ